MLRLGSLSLILPSLLPPKSLEGDDLPAFCQTNDRGPVQSGGYDTDCRMLRRVRAIALVIREKARYFADVARIFANWCVVTADSIEQVQGLLHGDVSSQPSSSSGEESAPAPRGSESGEGTGEDVDVTRPGPTGDGGKGLPPRDARGERTPSSDETPKAESKVNLGHLKEA
jgi:hypothetical protein